MGSFLDPAFIHQVRPGNRITEVICGFGAGLAGDADLALDFIAFLVFLTGFGIGFFHV
jgi:hypothetical protein